VLTRVATPDRLRWRACAACKLDVQTVKTGAMLAYVWFLLNAVHFGIYLTILVERRGTQGRSQH